MTLCFATCTLWSVTLCSRTSKIVSVNQYLLLCSNILSRFSQKLIICFVTAHILHTVDKSLRGSRARSKGLASMRRISMVQCHCVTVTHTWQSSVVHMRSDRNLTFQMKVSVVHWNIQYMSLPARVSAMLHTVQCSKWSLELWILVICTYVLFSVWSNLVTAV
jgi:hypothetical protein